MPALWPMLTVVRRASGRSPVLLMWGVEPSGWPAVAWGASPDPKVPYTHSLGGHAPAGAWAGDRSPGIRRSITCRSVTRQTRASRGGGRGARQSDAVEIAAYRSSRIPGRVCSVRPRSGLCPSDGVEQNVRARGQSRAGAFPLAVPGVDALRPLPTPSVRSTRALNCREHVLRAPHSRQCAGGLSAPCDSTRPSAVPRSLGRSACSIVP